MGLWVQQWVLRRVNLLRFRQPLVVYFVFVPSSLQPADPVSRLEELCGGSRSQALEAARVIWRRLGDNMSCALYIGSVAWYVGGDLGRVVPLPRELEGGGAGALGLFGRLRVLGKWRGRVGLCAS